MDEKRPFNYPGSRMKIDTNKIPQCESCGSTFRFIDGQLICANKHCKSQPQGTSRYTILIRNQEDKK